MDDAQDQLVSLFRQLAEEADDVFWVSDPVRKRILYISRSYEVVWGRAREALYANPLAFLEGIHPDDRARVAAAHPHQAQGLFDEAYRVVRPDGTHCWVHAKAYPIRDQDGTVTRICGIAHDITATKAAEASAALRRQQLEDSVAERSALLEIQLSALNTAELALVESEARLGQLVDSAHDAVVVIDADGLITDWNRRAEALFNWTREQSVGKLLSALIIPPEMRERHEAGLARFRAKGTSSVIDRVIEVDAIRRDGSRCPIELSIWSFQSRGVPSFGAFIRDISARRISEHALQQSEEKYRQVVEYVGQGMVVVQNGQFVFANPKAQEITGYPLDELVSFAFDNIVHPDDQPAVRERHAQRLRGEEVPGSYEFRIIDRQGNPRWLEVGGTLISWDGAPAILSFFSDVSRRKALEAELTTSLAERETTLQHSIVGVAFLTPNGRLRWANDALGRIFRTSQENCIGQSLEAYYRSREHYLEMGRQVMQAVAQGVMYETELLMRRHDGELFWAYLSGKAVNPNDLSQGTVWVLMDISERRELEARLQRQTVEQEIILQTSQIGIAHTTNRLHQWINATFSEMIGFSQAELIGNSSRCHFPSEEAFRKLGEDAYPQMASGASYACECQMMRKSGEVFWVHMCGKNVDPEDPKKGTIWTVMDITKRKQLEQRLSATSSEREAILQSALVGITFTIDRKHQWVNRKFAEMMGHTPEAMIGQCSLVHYKDQASWAALGQAAYPRLAIGETFETEWEMKRSDGSLFWAQIYGSCVELGHPEKGTIWTFLDISERRRAEEDTLRALEKQKELNELKSRFVSMTSHEFRTPLATILSSAELLKYYSDRLPAGEKVEILSSIESSVKRMTQMLDNVLLIGKAEAQMLTCKTAPIDLQALCRSCAREIEIAARSEQQPRLRLEIGDDIRVGHFDEKLLHHVLGNLLSNAFKYSPGGGEVLFSVKHDKNDIVFHVADQGIGIPERDLPRLFETFHRAENVGNIQGTGLGLAIVKKAVELHGGRIDVSSEEGRGTRFTVRIPDNGKDHG